MKLFNPLIRLLIDDSTRTRYQQGEKKIEGLTGLLKVLAGHFYHPALYNPLALLAGIVFMVNLNNPWWHARVDEGRILIDAFAFVLKHTVPPIGRVFIIETPLPLTVILIIGLFLYFFLVFWGSTMAGKKGRLFVASGGLMFLLYTAGFYGTLVYALHRIDGFLTEDFVVFSYGGMRRIDVHPYFWTAYYWAIGSAIICTLSSLIHGLLPLRFYKRKKEFENEQGNGL